MKIESRVEALEHELKILKNEIQATLLEIREQVLNHYYPELRASEPPRTKFVPKSSDSKGSDSKASQARANDQQEGRNGKQASSKGNGRGAMRTAAPADLRTQVNPFSDISLRDMGLDIDDLDDIELDEIELEDMDFDDEVGNDHPTDDEQSDNDELKAGHYGLMNDNDDDEFDAPPPARSGAKPRTREVNLQQLKRGGTPPKGTPRNMTRVSIEPTVSQPAASQPPKPTRNNFGALAGWVSGAIAVVGKERTLQVVETYAASAGTLPVEAKSSILQMISLASDEEPATPVGNKEMLGLMVELDKILGEA